MAPKPAERGTSFRIWSSLSSRQIGPGLAPDGVAAEPSSDYLYVSLTAATAFSPTDAMPYTGRAKLVMGIEATMSFAIFAMLVARAVNIAHG